MPPTPASAPIPTAITNAVGDVPEDECRGATVVGTGGEVDDEPVRRAVVDGAVDGRDVDVAPRIGIGVAQSPSRLTTVPAPAKSFAVTVSWHESWRRTGVTPLATR